MRALQDAPSGRSSTQAPPIPTMPEIQLSPAGSLRWVDADQAPTDAALAGFAESFRSDWREALFQLAARRPQTSAWPSLRYWQVLAETYLTAI